MSGERRALTLPATHTARNDARPSMPGSVMQFLVHWKVTGSYLACSLEHWSPGTLELQSRSTTVMVDCDGREDCAQK